MKNGKYSISDVANMLGVSKATVSRAINGNPGVGDELRKRVLDLVDEIGYRPNTIAKSLIKGHVNIIALILGDIRNPFYADLTFYIQQRLNKSGYMLVVLNSEYYVERELEFLDMIQQFSFAGLILLTAQDDGVENTLKALDLPKVLVNRVLPSYNGNSVLTDNFKAGYMAVTHLFELGHTRIGFVRGPQVSSASRMRYLGYCQALGSYGLPFQEDFVFDSDLKMEAGREVALDFAKKDGEKPTAMIIVNDLAAIGFMDGCREKDIRIPEDISIVSFDNIAFSSIRGIELTTIGQNVRMMGEQAARLILKQIEGKDTKIEKIVLEPTLFVRNSTRQFDETNKNLLIKP